MLSRLKWDLCAVTPHDFVDLLLTRLDVNAGNLPQRPRVDITDRWDSTRRDAHAFIAYCAAGKAFSPLVAPWNLLT